MNDTRRNALDTALIKFNQAQKYLELPSPGKKDFEQARDHAKDGLDLVKACLVALDHDCFEIMDRPPLKPEPGPSLFTPTGAPSAEAEVAVEIPAAAPSLPALGMIDAEIVEPVALEAFPEGASQEFLEGRFSVHLAQLEEMFCDHETDAGRDDYQAQLRAFRAHGDAWRASWKIDQVATWDKLQTTLFAAGETALGETFSAWSPTMEKA